MIKRATDKQPVRLVVSSKMITNWLYKEVRFTCPKPRERFPYVMMNGVCVGVTQEPFAPFRVDAERITRLGRVCQQLQEQPVTLVWNGEHFWLEDFKI